AGGSPPAPSPASLLPPTTTAPAPASPIPTAPNAPATNPILAVDVFHVREVSRCTGMPSKCRYRQSSLKLVNRIRDRFYIRCRRLNNVTPRFGTEVQFR